MPAIRLAPGFFAPGFLPSCLDSCRNILSYCRLRVTNAVAEGINSKIMGVKRRAAGYRNREHFKTAIYFYCGGLDLHPR